MQESAERSTSIRVADLTEVKDMKTEELRVRRQCRHRSGIVGYAADISVGSDRFRAFPGPLGAVCLFLISKVTSKWAAITQR